jgi:TrkA domain protein
VSDIEETQLPGVGVRHDFRSTAGTRIGVVTHRTGARELLIYDRDDPDRCEQVVRLSEDDTRTLGELLGGSRVSDSLVGIRQAVEGLAIDWLPVEASSACAGRTIAEYGIRAAANVSIVAVIRGDETFPSPKSSFRMEPGDTLVVVGTPIGIEAAFKQLRGE